MTTNTNLNSTPTADVPGDGNPPALEPSTFTITRYQQLAEQFMTGLDVLAAIIPKLEVPHPATAKVTATHQSVPNVFLASTIDAVEQSVELQGLKLDVPESRDALQFIDAFRAAANKLSGLTRSLEFTLRSRKAALAINALQIYEVAKGVARDPGRASVAMHVANMQRDLNRRRPSQKLPAEVRKAARAAANETFKATVLALTAKKPNDTTI